MEIETRRPRNEDESALRHIWKAVFGSSDEDIFFGFYFDRSMCITTACGGTPVSSGFLIPAGNMLSGELAVPCAMIYAVATLPEYRRHGYGSETVRALISAGWDAGFPAVVLCPSSDDLFDYYSENTKLRDWFFANELSCGLPRIDAGLAGLSRITSEEYRVLRNSLLAGRPYIESDRRALEYQNLLCEHYGGGLYKVCSSGGVSCAVVENAPDGVVIVKELLTSAACETEVLSAIADAYPAYSYKIMSPVQSHSSAARRFGMLAITEELERKFNKESVSPWYGLAFD